MQVSYNSWLVATSLAVAILASYVALNLVANVAAARGRRASMLWLAGSALAMGTGIWILACTANAMSDEVLHCIEAGMDGYLVKPLDLNSLMTELKRWLPGAAGVQAVA